MPDQFTEQTNIGYGQRLINSFSGIIFGPLLVIGAIVLLYWNEGRINIAQHARKAIEVSAQMPAMQVPAEALVAVSGIVHTSDMLSDNEFIMPGNYLALARNTQVYAWVEHTEEREQKNLGGSVTKETTYTYTKKWVDEAQQTSAFKHPEEHDNKQKTIANQWVVAPNASIGMYALDTARLALPGLSEVSLSTTLLRKKIAAVLVADDSHYLFVGRESASSYREPQVGDMRISFAALKNDLQGTVFGAIQNNTLVPYAINEKTAVYRLFVGTKQDALHQLQHEHGFILWMLRLLGVLLMWIGFMFFVSFISIILDVVPLFGSFASALLGALSLAVALVMSVVVILISWVAHSLVLLIVLAMAGLLGVTVFLWRRSKKRSV